MRQSLRSPDNCCYEARRALLNSPITPQGCTSLKPLNRSFHRTRSARFTSLLLGPSLYSIWALTGKRMRLLYTTLMVWWSIRHPSWWTPRTINRLVTWWFSFFEVLKFYWFLVKNICELPNKNLKRKKSTTTIGIKTSLGLVEAFIYLLFRYALVLWIVLTATPYCCSIRGTKSPDRGRATQEIIHPWSPLSSLRGTKTRWLRCGLGKKIMKNCRQWSLKLDKKMSKVRMVLGACPTECTRLYSTVLLDVVERFE